MDTHLRLGRGGTRPEGELRAPRLTLAAAAALACAALVVQLASAWPDVRYLTGAATLCVAVICARRALSCSHARAGWLALAVATAALAAGRVPVAEDVGQLGCYAAGCVALVLLGRARFRRRSWSLLLDAVVAALTLAALATWAAADGGIGARNPEFPILNVLVVAVVTIVSVWQGFRASRETALVSAGLVTLAVADANGLGVLLAALLITIASCFARDRGHETHTPERWLAIVAPTALSFANIVLLSYGRLVAHVTSSSMSLARVAVLFAFVRVFLSFVATQRMLTSSLREAASDALTGLPNRRALIQDSAKLFLPPSPQHVLAIYDLDGFKQYNDAFGHDDGDTMLSMLGGRLSAAVAGRGRVYRLGGDEFCLIAPSNEHDADVLVAEVGAALSEEGPGFAIHPSYGAALVPTEASDLTEALRLADRRMYEHKAARAPEPALELATLRAANA